MNKVLFKEGYSISSFVTVQVGLRFSPLLIIIIVNLLVILVIMFYHSGSSAVLTNNQTSKLKNICTYFTELLGYLINILDT